MTSKRSKFSSITEEDILAVRVVERHENSMTMSIKLKTGKWVTDSVPLGRKIEESEIRRLNQD
jgi:hypothetical protein